MIKLLLGLSKAPTPHDALAVAICHLHLRPWGHPGARDEPRYRG
jgi:Holliday junction resolvasome RuvABC endonuclease subunit